MEEATEQVPVEEQTSERKLTEALAGFEGAPAETEIVAWKQKYGEILLSGFSETELFIWRPVSRQEFVQLQIDLSQQQTSALAVEETVVKKCLLWVSQGGKEALQRKAGSFSTLHEQIMQQSNFVAPQVAAQLVARL